MSDVTKSGILLFVTVVVVVAIAAFTVGLLYLMKPKSYGDSGGSVQSGFTVMTDNLTGCQYLYRNGAMQPRFDKTGKQICENGQK